MYVIGFWLNKNLKLHTYCVSAKPVFTAIGAGSARLSWLPTFGIPPLVPSRLLKEEDNRIRSGFLGSSIDCHIREAGKLATWVTGTVVRRARPLPRVRKDGTLAVQGDRTWETRDKSCSPSSKPHLGTLTLYHLWHYPQSPQAMLMLITEMLITQGVTNTPYKSPHPRHREKQNEGDTLAHTNTLTQRLHPLSQPVVRRQVALNSQGHLDVDLWWVGGPRRGNDRVRAMYGE